MIRRLLRRLVSSAIARTASINLAILAASLLTGILAARALGEAGRGHYAAIMAWQGIALTTAELGQSAATTFFSARHPAQIESIIRQALVIMVPLSVVVFVIGAVLSFPFSDGSTEILVGYLTAFGSVLVVGCTGPYLYALQFVDITRWNLARIAQPIVFMVLAATLFAAHRLTLITVGLSVLASITATQLLAVWSLRRTFASETYPSNAPLSAHEIRGSLASYGTKHWASALPASLGSSADRVALSWARSPEDLGRYSVAQSLVGVVGPISTSISAVVFPQLAGSTSDEQERRRYEIQLLLGSTVIVLALLLVLCGLSGFLIPLVFGSAFATADRFAWWIAPAVLSRSVLLVIGTFLRARGRPGTAGLAETTGLAVLLVLTFVLVPLIGVIGAPLAATCGQCVSIAIGLTSLVRIYRSTPAPRPVAGVPS